MNKKLLLGGMLMAVGITVVTLWMRSRWPEEKLQTEFLFGADGLGKAEFSLDKPVQVMVTTNQEFERTKRLGVSATLKLDGAEVTSSGLQERHGKANFVFQVMPREAMEQRPMKAGFVHRGIEMISGEKAVSVRMPNFASDASPSFLEMVSAPDASIYGSHITVWNQLGETELFMVTGHAESSVCREASAALFGLATQAGAESPYFMLGAGVGCIDVTGFKEQIDKDRAAFTAANPELMKIMAEAYKTDPMARLAAMFSSDKTSKSGPSPEWQQRWLSRLDGVLNNLDEADKSAGIDRAKLKPLSDALEALGEHADAGEGKALLDKAKPASEITPQSLEALRGLLKNQELAIQALSYQQETEFEEALKIIRGWDHAKRDAFKKGLGQMMEKTKAFETATRSMDDLQERTGLVRFHHSTVGKKEQVDRITGQVARWAGAPQGTASIELAALASGHDGCLLLPFFDREGKPVEFSIAAELLAGEDGGEWRKVMKGNAARELAANANEIHERFKVQIERGKEQLERVTVLAVDADEGGASGLSGWLPRTKTYNITMYDTKGRPAGTESRVKSNLQLLLDAWEYVASNRALERFYARLVESSREMDGNPRFARISDNCLLDSLLRGWKLAFADDDTEKRFEAWSERTRNAVWDAIWRQAAGKGFDCRLLLADGTIFQIEKRPDGSYAVRPRFVADIGQTMCVRGKTGGSGYASSWSERQTVRYKPEQADGARETPEAFAEAKWKAVEGQLGAAVDHVLKSKPEERAKALADQTREFTRAAESGLRLALCAAPEQTVAAMTARLLAACGPVKQTEELDKDDEARVKALEEWQGFKGDLNERWKAFRERLIEGTWPFADEYLLFTVVWRDEVESETDQARKKQLQMLYQEIEKQGRKIDNAYMDAGLRDKESSQGKPSTLLRSILEKSAALDGARVIDALRLVVLLSEAARSIQDWDDRALIEFYANAHLEESKKAAATLPVVAALRGDLTARLEAETVDLPAVGTVLERMASDMESHQTDAGLQRRFRALASRIDRWKLASAQSEGGNPGRARLSAALQAALSAMRDVSPNNWLGEITQAQAKLLEPLISRVTQGPYEAVDRQEHRHDIGEMISALVDGTRLRLERMHRDAPSRRTLEMLVQLQWTGSMYSQALATLRRDAWLQAMGRVPAEKTSAPSAPAAPRADIDERIQLSRAISADLRDPSVAALLHALKTPDASDAAHDMVGAVLLASLCRQQEAEMLKACVYSGGEFFGASIFGKRPGDWVSKPRQMEDVVTAIKLPVDLAADNGVLAEFAALRKQPAPAPGAPAREVAGFKIGDDKRSFTDVIAYPVEDAAGNRSIFITMPNDARGLNLQQMKAAAEISDHLAQRGVDVAHSLPAQPGGGRKLMVNDEVVVARQTFAPGRQMSRLGPNGSATIAMTPQEARLYARANFKAFVKGADLPPEVAIKEAVTDMETMRTLLLKRLQESEQHFEAFSATSTYRQAHGSEVAAKGKAFHDAYQRFVETFWKGDDLLSETGLVHDAIPANCFIEGEKVTLIDFGSDYIGSAGTLTSTLMTHMRAKPGSRSFEAYKQAFKEALDIYAETKGVKLDDAQKLEIVQHLWAQPYKFLSSDSGQVMTSLRQSCGLPSSATHAEVMDAIRKPENQAHVEAFLKDPAVQEKYDLYMEDVEHALRLFDEMLPKERAADRAALQEMLKQVQGARASKLRVTLAPQNIVAPAGLPA